MRIHGVFLLGALAWSALAAAPADPRERLPGGLKPIGEVIATVEAREKGEIVEIEFEDDEFLYEVYLIDPDGRRIELKVDARTGAILQREVDD